MFILEIATKQDNTIFTGKYEFNFLTQALKKIPDIKKQYNYIWYRLLYNYQEIARNNELDNYFLEEV